MGIIQGILQIALILLISYILIKLVVSCINRITKKRTVEEPIMLLYEHMATIDVDVIPTPPPSPTPADEFPPPPPGTEDPRND